MPRKLLAVSAAIAAFVGAPTALAKNFRPGDLRLCNAHACVAVESQPALDALSGLYYGTTQLAAAARPRLGAPMLRLEFRNGYVTGIVSGRSLDRFLSYGVNLGRLERSTWYRVPTVATRELRRLSAKVQPLRLTRAATARSR